MHRLMADACHPTTHSVLGVPLIERVLGEGPLALDDSQAIAWEGEEVALPGAEAAVALVGHPDLGHLELEDEGAAMAVAAIRLEGFRLGHVVTLSQVSVW